MQCERLKRLLADPHALFPDPRSHLARCAARRSPPAIVMRRRNREGERWYRQHGALHGWRLPITAVA